MEFAGKCYLVTGGSRGIGRATCEALLEAGANVVACARDWSRAEGLWPVDAPIRTLAVDVRCAEDLVTFRDTALAAFGRIDGLVSNAGAASVGSVLDTPDGALEDHIAARLLAAWRLIRLCAPHMRAAGGGGVVIVAGAAGLDPTPMLAAPGIVNAALQNLSRAVADELAEFGIRCNVVNPGTLDTRLGREVIEAYAQRLDLDPELIRDEAFGSVPLGRLPTPADLAETICFLLSDRAAMITGGCLTPDGGILIRRARG